MCSLSLEHWCPKCPRIETLRTYHPCLQGIMSHLCWVVAQQRVRARVFCCVNANKIPFGGGAQMGLQLALKSSCCQTTKTIRPAVEELHCCITEVDSIQCFRNSPLTEPNWFYAQKFVFEDEHLFGGGNRCSWLLPNHPTFRFEIWRSKWKFSSIHS